MMNRRDLLRLGGAAALAMPFAAGGARAQAGDMMPALAEAYDHHRKFRACFAIKFRTGYCDFSGFDGRSTPPHRMAAIVGVAARRLQRLSSQGRTAALIYHVRDGGGLDVFLLDEGGPVAWSRAAADVDALLDGLRVELRLAARAATRAARPLNAPAPAQAAAPVGLDRVAEALLPLAVARALIERGYRRLLVLASGAVGQAPFPALRLPDGQALVDRASVVLLADPEALFLGGDYHVDDPDVIARAFDFSMEEAMRGQKLMVGNPAFGAVPGWRLPPLPGAEAEIAEVATEFMADDVLVGRRATRRAVMASLEAMQDRGGIAYFATHGVSDSVDPMDGSFLALAGDVIYGQAIRRLKMPFHHPLVVMSACQSGLGKAFGGGGYGLARAWYAAGAGQVVGSLWNVSDEGTGHMMTRFARAAASGSMTVEEALRYAMRATRDGFSDDPAVWASFVAFGNPGA